ncbi:heme uptake protein IsdC [Viridibacillus arvi]|uniref:heme uptake protein IsdC n=1 Tax=Viridibacillus arvi TaxID=263475 RepID=UPI003D08EB19
MKTRQFSIINASIIAIICSIFFLSIPVGDAEAALSDGTYSINYTVISPDNGSASMANDYFVKPAKLFVENGSMKVQLTIKNSKWITKFQVQDGGNSVISTNSSANTRVVQFNVGSISNPTTAKIKVDIDDMNYHHNYTIRLKFDESSTSLVNVPATGKTTAETKNNATGSENSSTSNDSSETTQIEENPKTGDSATVVMFVVMLLTSSLLLIKKF